MISKSVFVTVGTTKFEKLVTTVCDNEVLSKLHSLGFNSILLQYGTGDKPNVSHQHIDLKFEQYLNDFTLKIKEADLVISHAGAGSCLEVLKEGKPLIVVINEELMDNHQIELADQLQKDGYVYYCTCDMLKDILSKNFNKLKRYSTPNPELFSSYLDKCMGFV